MVDTLLTMNTIHLVTWSKLS